MLVARSMWPQPSNRENYNFTEIILNLNYNFPTDTPHSSPCLVYWRDCFCVADVFSEPVSSETLAANDSLSTLDAESDATPAQRPLRLDIIPPPPNNHHSSRRSPLVSLVCTHSSTNMDEFVLLVKLTLALVRETIPLQLYTNTVVCPKALGLWVHGFKFMSCAFPRRFKKSWKALVVQPIWRVKSWRCQTRLS